MKNSHIYWKMVGPKQFHIDVDSKHPDQPAVFYDV